MWLFSVKMPVLVVVSRSCLLHGNTGFFIVTTIFVFLSVAVIVTSAVVINVFIVFALLFQILLAKCC